MKGVLGDYETLYTIGIETAAYRRHPKGNRDNGMMSHSHIDQSYKSGSFLFISHERYRVGLASNGGQYVDVYNIWRRKLHAL